MEVTNVSFILQWVLTWNLKYPSQMIQQATLELVKCYQAWLNKRFCELVLLE